MLWSLVVNSSTLFGLRSHLAPKEPPTLFSELKRKSRNSHHSIVATTGLVSDWNVMADTLPTLWAPPLGFGRASWGGGSPQTTAALHRHNKDKNSQTFTTTPSPENIPNAARATADGKVFGFSARLELECAVAGSQWTPGQQHLAHYYRGILLVPQGDKYRKWHQCHWGAGWQSSNSGGRRWSGRERRRRSCNRKRSSGSSNSGVADEESSSTTHSNDELQEAEIQVPQMIQTPSFYLSNNTVAFTLAVILTLLFTFVTLKQFVS